MGSLLAGGLPGSFDVCFTEVFILNSIPVVENFGPLCLSLIEPLIQTLTGAEAQDEAVRECTATIGDNKCTSCFLCDDDAGVTFDCTNIDSSFGTSTCANINLPTTLMDIYYPDALADIEV